MKKVLVVVMLLITTLSAYADPFDYRKSKSGFKYIYRPHNESSYQHAHCSACNGIEEYELSDKTRVDCLTDKYAIEYDFANKNMKLSGKHFTML